MSSVRKKLAGPKLEPLPASPQVGDRIRIKEDDVISIRTACKLAGYDVTIDRRTLTVARVIEKGRESPHGRQIVVQEFRQPTFWAEQVELAWDRNGKERRKALIAAGSWVELDVEVAS